MALNILQPKTLNYNLPSVNFVITALDFLTDLSHFLLTFHSFDIEQLPSKVPSCLLQPISLHVVKCNVPNVLTLLLEETFLL